MKHSDNKKFIFESSLLIQSYIHKWAKLDESSPSLRNWSKLMKLSPSYLSLILKSQRLVSEKALNSIAVALDLDKISIYNLKSARQRDWIKLKGENQKNPTDEINSESKKELSIFADEIIDNGKILLKSWAHMAFLDYTTCQKLPNDIESIAKLFNLTPSAIKQIIFDLKQGGFLKQNPDNSYSKTEKNLRISAPRSNKAIRAFHIAMMKKACETLEKETTPDEVRRRLVSSYTVAANENQLEKTFELINQAFSNVMDQLKIDPCTTVYQVQFQIVPLLTRVRQ